MIKFLWVYLIFLLMLIIVRFLGCFWYYMSSFQRIQQFIPVEIANHEEKTARAGNKQEFSVLIIAGATAAHGEQDGSEQAPDC